MLTGMAKGSSEPDLFSAAREAVSVERASVREEVFTSKALILHRQTHPAWQLLAARRAPLVLGCLKPLFDAGSSQIPLEEVRAHLAKALSAHANDPDFEIDTDDFPSLARKELRLWIKKGLLAERAGEVFATDSLQTAFRFIEELQDRMMTSTASRLSTVQQKIASLETALNPDKKQRIAYLESQIKELKKELAAARRGEFEVLEGDRAAEEVREVYSLAMSLRADFRRVEDSYREADRELRQAIISEDQNRGEVVDRLLETNEQLLNTPEGKVFSGFYQQIMRGNELDEMRARLQRILSLPQASNALNRRQAQELRGLYQRLINESENILQARTRSEKDVRGFIKTGLASEHHRVGTLLKDILETALEMDWNKQAVRRAPSPLPPIGFHLSQMPLPERLLFKSIDEAEEVRPDLRQQEGSLEALTENYLENFDDLDRDALFRETLALLKERGESMTIGEIARELPPEYDLEALAYWISLAREAELPVGPAREILDLSGLDPKAPGTRFDLPETRLTAEAVSKLNPILFE